jgi:uncharacterized protein YjiS (DUF1127 family)
METQMSDVNFHHSALFGQTFGFVKDLARRYRQRRELNNLLSLPGYMLKDVGLSRSDIQRESIKPLWQE